MYLFHKKTELVKGCVLMFYENLKTLWDVQIQNKCIMGFPKLKITTWIKWTISTEQDTRSFERISLEARWQYSQSQIATQWT